MAGADSGAAGPGGDAYRTDGARTGGRTARAMSTPELVKLASEQATRLARAEVRLAQAELRDKGRHAGIGIGTFSAAGALALYGLGVLITTAVLALALVLPAWLAALLVGVVLFLIVGILLLVGRSQLRKVGSLVPKKAMASTKTDAEYLRESVGR